MIDRNLTGQFRCARAALGPMVESGGGSMIHVSSVNGLQGIGLTGYSAAKSGILGLSRVIAAQYGGHGIRSNVACPGTTESEVLARKRAENWTEELRTRFLDQYPLDRFGDGGFSSGTDQELLDMPYDIGEPVDGRTGKSSLGSVNSAIGNRV